MVGIVVVSHSRSLAEGVVELAREMGGDELALEAAGGLEDGSMGTDAERVRAAIERAMTDDGVLVLMDLGSALMSAEMAVEFLESGGEVALSEAPLVEGTVAAAVAARGGASLAEVRAEARRAITMKEAQLGVDGPPGAGDSASGRGDGVATPTGQELRIPVLNEIGLHARPAALVAELANRFDVDLRLAKVGGGGPVSARSLTGLMTLVARKGDELLATASGSQADEALAALEELARDGFGEGVSADTGSSRVAARAPTAVPTSAAPVARAAAPEPGTLLRGIAASAGIALGPARYFAEQLDAPPERASEGAEVEWSRLESAREAARSAIQRDREEMARRTTSEDAAIFQAHLALLDDDALVGAARARIDGGASAEAAWYAASEATAAAWRALDDDLLRERAADVEDVGRRVLALLLGTDQHGGIDQAGVLVVSELTPTDAAALDPQLIRGIAAAHGTATAHAAILARALGIPAVVGLGPSVLAVGEGTPLLLEGSEGTVLVGPDEAAAERALHERELAEERRRRARHHAHKPAVHDGWNHDRGCCQSRRGGRGRGSGRARGGRRRSAADGVPVSRSG